MVVVVVRPSPLLFHNFAFLEHSVSLDVIYLILDPPLSLAHHILLPHCNTLLEMALCST